jgi:hypothetical protein
MTKTISPKQQMLIIEKLYRSQDSIYSTEKFNKEYQDKIGKMGDRTLELNDFARKMKKTAFTSFDVERFTKEITGEIIDLETL